MGNLIKNEIKGLKLEELQAEHKKLTGRDYTIKSDIIQAYKSQPLFKSLSDKEITIYLISHELKKIKSILAKQNTLKELENGNKTND